MQFDDLKRLIVQLTPQALAPFANELTFSLLPTRLVLTPAFAHEGWVQLQRQLQLAPQLQQFEVELQLQIGAQHHAKALKGVKQLIAVTSGKGGVGKSTVAVNLAAALKRLGAKVGLLDADIYGPSLPTMMGLHGLTEGVDEGLIPSREAHGISVQSIGLLVGEQDATIWRGPMASKALMQLAQQTPWDVDYLVVDMPPGTGDIQLTLAQQLPVNGAIVVTTPQIVALADARKGISMFNRVQVPLLGLVENMSSVICNECGAHNDVFGAGGGVELAKSAQVELLGQLPLSAAIRQDCDEGIPTVLRRADDAVSDAYLQLAGEVSLSLWQHTKAQGSVINVTNLG